MPSNFQTCGLLRRIGAMLYDIVIVIALLIIGTLIIMPFTNGNAIGPGHILFQVYLLIIQIGYYITFWVHGGQTLGMRAWRIRVLNQHYEPLTWPQATQRLCFAVITLVPAGFGLLWGFTNAQRRTLYDQWSKTYLVKLSPRSSLSRERGDLGKHKKD